jgi:hypothetical protein
MRLPGLLDARWNDLMALLSIGDRVVDASGAHEGRIIDIDGGIACVMQPNGAEIEFPLGKLKLYEDAQVKAARASAPPLRDLTLSPAHRRLLASVPNEIRDAVAQSYDKGGDPGARQAFAELPDDKKLETIRIYLPSLPRQLLSPHLRLVVAFRDITKETGPGGQNRQARKT